MTIFGLMSSPAQPQPFSDWLSRVRRIADHEPRTTMTDEDWASPCWHAFYDCGLTPAEAFFDYMED